MQPTVGDIFEGKVTGITKFGAFISMPDGKNGLVHISEIASTYVNDVSDHLVSGQSVKVKIIGISPEGKINLSIKQAQPSSGGAAERPAYQKPNPERRAPPPKPSGPPQPVAEPSFEDKLKQFMHDSDSRISDSRMYSDKKGGYKKRR